MTKQEQVKAIFIEEAGEIIDKLDIDILNFEENPHDEELLNGIFRGVHTLKGNANAFGFTRLGGFVHHFEDVLGYYRSSKDTISPSEMDLFVNSVDVIKETMQCELDMVEILPPNYDIALQQIKVLLIHKESKGEISNADQLLSPELMAINIDLGKEFGFGCDEKIELEITRMIELFQKQRSPDLKLYKINLKLDADCFKRGFDHIMFIHQLAEHAEEIETFFNFEHIQPIESFQFSENMAQNVVCVVMTQLTPSEIEEIFEYLFEHEYSVKQIDIAKIEPLQQEEHRENDRREGNRRQNDRSNTETSTVSVGQKSTIRIDTLKVDELFDSVGELVIAQNFIAQNEKIASISDETIRRAIETLSKITKRIQDRVMSLRMVAIHDTFDKMKRVIRDTAKKTGKEVHLIVQGEETEIDKTMIDSLSDPLIHIIRNAIDHGLEENANERTLLGKNEEGTITLRAFHKSGNIVISVSDDGRGINRERVFQKAVERGLITADESLTDSQIYSLILQPGFSTAQSVSDLSGRGVGLDVVKTSIEKLRGKIEIDSIEGKGTTFSMILPLTLAIIDGMLVRSGEEIYIIPTLSVIESFRPEQEIIHRMKNKGEFVSMRGQHIPIIRLSDVFELKGERISPWEGILVTVESEFGRLAIMVDELIGRQQVVIKTLGKSMAKVNEISGGAILGNGEIALILNVDSLIHSVEDIEDGR